MVSIKIYDPPSGHPMLLLMWDTGYNMNCTFNYVIDKLLDMSSDCCPTVITSLLTSVEVQCLHFSIMVLILLVCLTTDVD